MQTLPPGFSVLVTRPVGQAEALCRLVEDAGGEAIRLPLLEIQPSAAGGEAMRQLLQSQSWDWLVFASANAVCCAFEWLGPRWLDGCRAKTAAIGQATEQALMERGVAVDLRPKQQFNSETLLASPEWQEVSGRRFLIVRGEGGRELLAETLRARGGIVEYAEVYRRTVPATDVEGLLARWRAGGVGVVTVTSGESLDNLFRLLAGSAGELMSKTPMVIIGERLAARARGLGCARVTAAEAGDREIFDAVVRIARELIETHQP